MAGKDSSPRLTALQEMEAALDAHRRTRAPAGATGHARAESGGRRFSLGSVLRWPDALRLGRSRRPSWLRFVDPRILFGRGHPILRNGAITIGVLVTLVLIGGGLLWWRLLSGPIALDLATPWLRTAVEQNFGNRYRVEVGGTMLERDAQGRTALRLRDIVLRDSSGASVAVAPKADIGISGVSLLLANPRVESFRLVDANMTVRIDPDGQINVILGGERPFSTIAPTQNAPAPTGPQVSAQASTQMRSYA